MSSEISDEQVFDAIIEATPEAKEVKDDPLVAITYEVLPSNVPLAISQIQVRVLEHPLVAEDVTIEAVTRAVIVLLEKGLVRQRHGGFHRTKSE